MRESEEQNTVKRVVSGHLGNEGYVCISERASKSPCEIICFLTDSSSQLFVKRKFSESIQAPLGGFSKKTLQNSLHPEGLGFRTDLPLCHFLPHLACPSAGNSHRVPFPCITIFSFLVSSNLRKLSSQRKTNTI